MQNPSFEIESNLGQASKKKSKTLLYVLKEVWDADLL